MKSLSTCSLCNTSCKLHVLSVGSTQQQSYAENTELAQAHWNSAVKTTMKPSSFVAGLGLVTNEPAVAVPASTKPDKRSPSIEELDSIELPNYGLAKDQSGMPTNAAKQTPKSRQLDPWLILKRPQMILKQGFPNLQLSNAGAPQTPSSQASGTQQ